MRFQEIKPKKLVIFDIDDTLVHTQTKVHVIKDGLVIKSLNSHDFTHYKLKPGEEFDFGDFRNAREFFEKSKPIIPMMRQLKQDISTGNKVVMVTARADFDDKELFLDTFRKYGVDMDKVHVYRAGNLKKGSTEERKKIIIKNLLDKGNYSKAIMYDDAKPNLHSFIELKKDYPKTRFYAWHVSLDGEASEYMREGIISEKKRKKNTRRSIYGPGLWGGYGYYAGYSGEGGEGGGDGVGEQTSQANVSKDDPYNPKKVRPLKDISDDEILQWLTPNTSGKPDQSKQTQSGQGTKVPEASYPGNIGAMEVYKFLKFATPEQVKIFKKLIDDKQFKTAWALIQGVTGIKLQGDEFNEDSLHGSKPTLIDAFRDFLPFVMQELRLKNLPKIKLRKHIPDEDQPTFGRFENDSEIVNLGIKDRHPLDVLRTLAHELVHYKQLLKNGLNKGSGETGSYDENQANVLAGIIMRKFNKKFPKYFDSSAINFNENFADGHNLHEKVQDYLWHGSREEHDVLYPRQAVDTGGAEGSNKNAVYATPNAKVAIAMGLTTPGSDTGMFPDDPQMVLFKGEIRKGEYVYLHKVPKDLFIKHNSREWYSKPDVKEITPIEIKAIPVNKWLHLIRPATPQDLELQKKYMKENFADGRNPQDKGDSRRHGIPKGASIAQLKKIRSSKTASPRKKQLAHWQINMRQGRKK